VSLRARGTLGIGLVLLTGLGFAGCAASATSSDAGSGDTSPSAEAGSADNGGAPDTAEAGGKGGAGDINTTPTGAGAGAPDVAEGQATLDAIAQAGGTQSAFVIDTSNDVASRFRAALENIRSTQLGCDFEIPPAKSGQSLDYSLVNVDFETGKKSSTLLYVGSVDQCDPLKGGWYYDTDPTVMDPSKIEVCATTCATFRAATNASVSVAVGCQTVVK
jgi:hypothetical protein